MQNNDVDQLVEAISSPSEPDRSSAIDAIESGGSISHALASDTALATGLAGSDTEADRMNPGIEVSSTADPSDVVEVSPQDLVNKNAPGSRTFKRTSTAADEPGQGEVTIKHIAGSRFDTTSGEAGAPEGIDAAGASGASGGTAGTSGSPGTGVGARP